MTATAPPLFSFNDVSVSVDGRLALDRVSLQIERTGITAVVGPSGSGKTTLLRLCNRLTVPSSGWVRYRGEPLDQLDPLTLRRAVGMVFQVPTPFPGTVRDNLLVAVADASEVAMVAALEDAGLERSFLSRDAQALSGGEAQRVCLARTLLTEPAVLLLDEPTSALDIDARLAFEGVVRRIADAGTSVVWVTHDLEQAQRVADRSIVLMGGRVASEAEARRFVQRGVAGQPDAQNGGNDGSD